LELTRNSTTRLREVHHESKIEVIFVRAYVIDLLHSAKRRAHVTAELVKRGSGEGR